MDTDSWRVQAWRDGRCVGGTGSVSEQEARAEFSKCCGSPHLVGSTVSLQVRPAGKSRYLTLQQVER
jgi:hypothetical protein